jgi:polygalacturonase
VQTRSLYKKIRVIPFLFSLPVALICIEAPSHADMATNTASPAAAAFSDSVCSATGAAAAQRVFQISNSSAGSGVDSTKTIQNAINTASADGGGRVALPAGTFTVDGHLVMKSNVELIGAGATTVIKAGPGFLKAIGPNGGYPVITTSGASNVTVADLTADQSGDVLNGNLNSGERLAGYLIDIRKSHNAVVTGVYTRNPFTYSIAVVDSNDFCVANSNTQVATSGRYDQLDGIHVLDSHTGQVIGNYVDQRVGTDGDDGLAAHTINAPVYDVLYAGNMVRGGSGGDGMQLAVGNYPVYDITIRDNTFWGSPFGIRTGYWNTGANASVYDVLISGNNIRNLMPGQAFPKGGNAIDIGDFGAVAPVTFIAVTGNTVCRAGLIIVVHGTGNLASNDVTNNSAC